MTQIFTKEETWYGGFYELAIEVGRTSDEQLDAALRRAWSFPLLEGCYLESSAEPDAQERLEPSLSLHEERYHLYGVAQMPNGCRVACGTVLVRESSGIDWLDIYLPMCGLGDAYEVGGYPFDRNFHSHTSWRQQVEIWFAHLGFYIYSAVQFRLGLIGHEVSGWQYADQLAETGIPKTRYIGYLWPEADTLRYFPMNQEETVTFSD